VPFKGLRCTRTAFQLTWFLVVVWHAEGKIRVHLKVFVDRNTAARLHAGKDQLRDNVIIRIFGGEDVTVSISIVALIISCSGMFQYLY